MQNKTHTLRARALLVLAVLVAAATGLPRVSAAEASRRSYNLLGESVGLVGYDPVSYFPEGGGKPVKGLISLSTELDGVTYRFATEAHKATFLKHPAKYVPAFGGWCTWAVAELGKRVDVDPESYVVKDGRLLVFYRDPALDTRAKFLENPEALLKKAEANWPALAK
jgi:YHS domain-containing protein